MYPRSNLQEIDRKNDSFKQNKKQFHDLGDKDSHTFASFRLYHSNNILQIPKSRYVDLSLCGGYLHELSNVVFLSNSNGKYFYSCAL